MISAFEHEPLMNNTTQEMSAAVCINKRSGLKTAFWWSPSSIIIFYLVRQLYTERLTLTQHTPLMLNSAHHLRNPKKSLVNGVYVFWLHNANVGYYCKLGCLAQHTEWTKIHPARNMDVWPTSQCVNVQCVYHNGGDKQFIIILGRIQVVIEDDDILLAGANLLNKWNIKQKSSTLCCWKFNMIVCAVIKMFFTA